MLKLYYVDARDVKALEAWRLNCERSIKEFPDTREGREELNGFVCDNKWVCNIHIEVTQELKDLAYASKARSIRPSEILNEN